MSKMRTRGMTLIEIMTAVAIIGVMVALAFVGMQRPIERQRESTAVRELWSAALRARQRALSTNQPVRLVVEPDIEQLDGTRVTLARWEQLTCDNAWDNNTCPSDGCEDTTCRSSPECCSATGEDIVIPGNVNAATMHGLCFLPGSGRAVHPGDLTCLQGQLNNREAVTAASVTTLPINFTTRRARALLRVEPLTGLTELLECDSQLAQEQDLAECE